MRIKFSGTLELFTESKYETDEAKQAFLNEFSKFIIAAAEELEISGYDDALANIEEIDFLLED